MPFQVMDEFDVYMDETVRRKALEMLLRNAGAFADQEYYADVQERQYIFITPNDISSVVPGSTPSIRVTRLDPPERGIEH